MSAIECSFGPVPDEQLAARAQRVLQTSFPLTDLAENGHDLLERITQWVTQRLAHDLGVEPGELSSKSMLVAQEEVRAVARSSTGGVGAVCTASLTSATHSRMHVCMRPTSSLLWLLWPMCLPH